MYIYYIFFKFLYIMYYNTDKNIKKSIEKWALGCEKVSPPKKMQNFFYIFYFYFSCFLFFFFLRTYFAFFLAETLFRVHPSIFYTILYFFWRNFKKYKYQINKEEGRGGRGRPYLYLL